MMMKNIQTEMITVSHILDEMRKLGLRREDDECLSNRFHQFMEVATKFFKPRMSLKEAGSATAKGMAQDFIRFIPGQSEEALLARIANGDDKAMVFLADTHLFYLRNKNDNNDKEFAYQLYHQAAALGNPEAHVALAISQLFSLMPQTQQQSGGFNPTLRVPPEMVRTPYHNAMWYALEASAELGHLSTFLLLQAENAKKYGDWQLSPAVKRLLQPKEEEGSLALRRSLAEYANSCHNPQCA